MQPSLLPASPNRQPARLLALAAVLLLLLLAGRAARAQSITGFSPASGSMGTTVTITGSGFTGATSVRFGEISALFTVNSSSQITATVPRVASTQPISVTTGSGFAQSSSAYVVTRASNSVTYGLSASNFAGVSGSTNAAPAVADLDQDGKLDLLVGRADGTISRYEQSAVNGTTFSSLGSLSTGSATIDIGTQATVAIADLDGNGRFELLLGRGDGTVSEYEQTGVGAGTFALVQDNLSAISTPSNTVTSMTDLDQDGYLELLVGKGDGIISQSEQSTLNTDAFYRIDTNFNGLQLPGGNAAPFFADLDGNGQLDMLVGVAGGTIYRYEQAAAGSFSFSQVSSSFNSISAGSNAKPCITDIDGDGLLDLLVGRGDGTIDRYEQGAGTNSAPTDISLSPASVAENQPVSTTVGTLSSTDPNAGNTFTYTFATGGADNGSFNISSTTLTTNGAFDYETKNTYSIRIRSTDQGGLFFEKTLTIGVTDVNETPTVTNFTPTSGPVGTSVVITGTHFNDAGAPTVKFNVTTATTLTVNSNTQITASVPTGATTGTISVTNADGTGTSSGTFTVGAVADLGVTLSATPTPVTEDATLTYTLTVSNAGPSTANSLTATLVLPAGAVFISGSGSGWTTSQASGTVTATRTSLATGAAPVITVQIQAPGEGGTITASASVSSATTDPVPANNSVSTNTMVNAVNDAPVVTVPATQTTNEDTPKTFNTANSNVLSLGDADAGSNSLDITLSAVNGTFTLSRTTGLAFIIGDGTADATMKFQGTLTNINAALNGLVFTPTLNFNGSASLSITANDLGNTGSGGAKTDTESVNINVLAPANQAPVVTAPATQTALFNTNLTFNAANGNALSVADADAGSGPVAIYLQATQGAVTLSTTAGLTFTSGSNGGGGFGFTGTLANINAALNGLVFRANNNYSGAASLQLQVDDQGNTGSGGAKSDSKTVAITVASNQAPVLVAGSGSAAWLQGGGAVAIAPALTASDADSPNLAGATVSITTGFASGQDVLAFANANGITGSYAAGTGILTLSGSSSVANYQAALRSVTYNNSAGTPTAGSRTISFVANDGSLNSAAVTRTVTVAVRPNTSIVSGPGTITNNSTVSFVFSSDQSPVLYETTGNPTFAFTNNGANPNFGPLADGTYTLSVAARNTSTGLTDATPATYTFTVDTQRPSVVVASTAASSGGSTATSPIPFTITFSENTANFGTSDVTVTGGTFTANAVSGSEYNVVVTPTGPGSVVTVSVNANVATDAAGNSNTASNAYSITYAPAPTITALSASAELPGMPITITGTRFINGSTVTFGGVAASSVVFNSATSLTATVPAGAAVGSSAVVVTTSGVSSSGSPAFSVLKVYDAVASCLSTVSYTTVGDGAWHYLLASNGQVVAAIQDTRAALGAVSVQFLIAGSASAVRQDAKAHRYLDRNWRLTATNSSFVGSSSVVRFYGLTSEFARLQAADASVSYATLKATQYSGANEDCQLGNNSAAGQHRTLNLTASTPGNGVAWFVAQATVTDHFSEFYLTGSAAPLPVELTAFTAEAQGRTVALAWQTASEKNSARFEVERSDDGREFSKIGELAAQGTKSSPTDYSYSDPLTHLPAYPQTLVYYRLRQLDLDGSASYSPVRSVTLGGKALLTLYPNPAHSAVAVAGLPAGAVVAVFDALGRVVAQATADAAGTTQLVLPNGRAAGVYVVRSGSQALRLMVE